MVISRTRSVAMLAALIHGSVRFCVGVTLESLVNDTQYISLCFTRCSLKASHTVAWGRPIAERPTPGRQPPKSVGRALGVPLDQQDVETETGRPPASRGSNLWLPG